MSRNDAIRRAIEVMSLDDTGNALTPIFYETVPGLRSQNIFSNDEGLMDEVKLTIKAIRAQLKRLSDELKAIDS